VNEELSSSPRSDEQVTTCLSLIVRFEDPWHVVAMAGELDMAGRAAVFRACTAAGQMQVLADMTNLVFMDCSGYRALVESRRILARRGGDLSLSNLDGEPLRLLTLIEHDARLPDRFRRLRATQSVGVQTPENASSSRSDATQWRTASKTSCGATP
jgi:anti-anti-sigma factor